MFVRTAEKSNSYFLLVHPLPTCKPAPPPSFNSPVPQLLLRMAAVPIALGLFAAALVPVAPPSPPLLPDEEPVIPPAQALRPPQVDARGDAETVVWLVVVLEDEGFLADSSCPKLSQNCFLSSSSSEETSLLLVAEAVGRCWLVGFRALVLSPPLSTRRFNESAAVRVPDEMFWPSWLACSRAWVAMSASAICQDICVSPSPILGQTHEFGSFECGLLLGHN